MSISNDKPTILLTGATGYVGGRLLKALESDGFHVRCLARRPGALRDRVASGTEVIAGDLLDEASLSSAMEGVQVAYYLVHSMGSSGAFEEDDRKAALNFGRVARQAGISRIIYLGGLGDSTQELSSHLKSRQEVGQLLKESGATVIEFQASIIIGAGSLSFEMIRALVERLPVMVTPRWVSVTAQPIGIDDVLEYLKVAATIPLQGNRVFQIGGSDKVTYGEIMREYAKQRRLRRLMLPVPVLTPYLSSLWLGLVTPLYARVGRRLIESIRHPTIVTDDSALKVFPIRPLGIKDMVTKALQDEDTELTHLNWSKAFLKKNGSTVRFGNRLVYSCVAQVDTRPANAFRLIERIGGHTGWYYGNFLWRLRGWLDLLLGGVGMRRGRKDPDSLRVGDTVDCWRVEVAQPGRMLRLVAEMKIPGRAWLQFEVEGVKTSTIRQTAIFDPVGVPGLLYWYALFPIHKRLFEGMLSRIAKSATPQDQGLR